MEPTDNNASTSISLEPLEDHLEKIVQDFEEFKQTALANIGSDAITLEELIDMYIFSGGMSLPADSNEAESLLPPDQEQSAYLQSTDDFNFDAEFLFADEMAEDASQNVMRIRYGDLKYQGAADSIIGSCSAESVFHSFMKSFTAPRKGRRSSHKKVNVKKNGDGATRRKYIKKRYKQIIEANEDIIAHHMGIKNLNRQVSSKLPNSTFKLINHFVI